MLKNYIQMLELLLRYFKIINEMRYDFFHLKNFGNCCPVEIYSRYVRVREIYQNILAYICIYSIDTR